MAGIFQSLDIARRAIWASRLGMDVTSHNIANVNTPGYSRQRVDSQAALPLQLPQGQLGLGVNANTITRIRSGLLDDQYRQTAFALGGASIRESLFSQVESVMQEPSENSIGSLMTEFFSEFSNLATEPENSAIRNTLRQKAITLVDTFHDKNQQLEQMKQSIRNDAASSTKQVNEITRQIAALNQQIPAAEAGGGSANDLRDRRDLLLDQLSEYVKITITENSQGQATVNTEGMTLVSGIRAKELSIATSSDGQNLQIQITSENGKSQQIKYGKLGGLLEMYNSTIPGLQEKLDTLAAKLAEGVNQLHSAGNGLPTGDPPTASTGINFFTGSSAGTIDISQEIMADVNNIAASNDATAGNGEVAIAISNLRNEKMLNGGTQTLDEYYSSAVNDLGIEIQKAQNTRSSQELVQDQITNQRDIESGVSLDEEMTNLIQYQRSFEAAAKVVQAVDEIMQTVINMV